MTMPHQPGAPVPPAGYGPVQQKKRKKWPWIVGGLVAVFVIASVSGGGDDDKPSTSAKTDTTAAIEAEAPVAEDVVEDETATMNTPVRDGKFEFVVNGVETGISTLGDNPYLAKEAQGQFVIVTMTVSNISDQPKSLSPSDQKLVDEQGRTFGPDTSAALNLDSDVPIWDKINPGNTVTMPVVFDMPVDAVPTAIELHDSMFSNGVTVSLR
ncbi:membrane protein [Rhodococcus gordoniae]|uniref:Membrane protein n=1 Tax=Rhodococcus gordoniae TaxID=223392 RepID=A0A379M2B6_9NOCA|nr:DUF4352 domain-containing protein [Rhodococcus gordoniae]SUE15753.1 membrane protein [Rhodococcus gordoniae]